MQNKTFKKRQKKVLSSLFCNLSAGWIGAALIAPNFTTLTSFRGIITLFLDIAAAIVCLLLALLLEE